MKICVAASELPHPQGTAAGRDLWGWCEALRALGHEVEAWVWNRTDSSPQGPAPDWAQFEPLNIPGNLRSHLRALPRPRNEASLGSWRPDPDSVAVADHIPSIGAVLDHPRSVVTFHYRVLADVWALRSLKLHQVQTARAERRAAHRGALLLAYSERVRRSLPGAARFVPICYPMPEEAVVPVEAPIAAVMSDWSWPPNRRALGEILRAWPRVRAAVPSARLLLGGRHLPTESIGILPGVEVVGNVANSLDILSQAAVIPFPCPASSGPKMKVLEALAHGIPVVTTPPGMEGILSGPDAQRMVVEASGFTARLVEVLQNPEERVQLAESARQSVSVSHAPLAAARARLQAFADAFGTIGGSQSGHGDATPAGSLTS